MQIGDLSAEKFAQTCRARAEGLPEPLEPRDEPASMGA